MKREILNIGVTIGHVERRCTMKRRKMSRYQSKRNFKRGTRKNPRNFRSARGGYRL